ncbi:MAG: CBS domain-containing protein [Planctomycetota bacterium]|jgi:CBS domain-containing protein
MTATAKDIMKPAVTKGPDARLSEIASTMETLRISIIPIVNQDNNLVGVVSKTDLVHVILAKNQEWDELTAEEAMSPAVVSCEPSSALSDVAALMQDNRIHHVLVMGEDGSVNVISALDLTTPLLRAYEMIVHNQSR